MYYYPVSRKSRETEEEPMRLLRMAIETQKWDLAAHVLILGAITARRKENDRHCGKKRKKRPRVQAKQR